MTDSSRQSNQIHLTDSLATRLAVAGVLPVLRAASARSALDAAKRCIDAGLDVIELTATTPDWRSALADVRSKYPKTLIGVGTVLLAADAIDATSLGADFLVSPCPAPEVRRIASETTPLLEGGMTVGELLSAADRGIAKLFPAHVGGTRYLRSIRAVAPTARIVPTGGIGLGDVAEWLNAGALAVGIGTDLLAHPDLSTSLAEVRAARFPNVQQIEK